MSSGKKYVVVVAGATGLLGNDVVNSLLSAPISTHFSRVVALSRDATSEKSVALKQAGAEVIQVSLEDESDAGNEKAIEGLTKLLKDVGADIVVNALAGGASARSKNNLTVAAVNSSVKVYFPSEFGIDYTKSDFGDFEHAEWIGKKDRVKFAYDAATKAGRNDFTVIVVANSAFLQWAIGPWFGFDVQPANSSTPSTFTALGSTNTRFGLTSTADIGRAVGRLAVVALEEPQKLAHSEAEFGIQSTSSGAKVALARIYGQVLSYEEIAEILKKVRGGSGEVVLKSVDLAEKKKWLREEVLAGRAQLPFDHLYVVISEGRADFSKDNLNELINPGETLWKWKTLEDYFREKEAQEAK